jgi:uroporphyrinogen-III synthase
MDRSAGRVPVLLLKTPSQPTDLYQECLESLDNGAYQPVFVPVLQHEILPDAISELESLLLSDGFRSTPDSHCPRYGGIIFTSQRAVQAFTHVIKNLETRGSNTGLDNTAVLYVVGPATARALEPLGLPCEILGEETGNGDALANFIISNYKTRWREAEKPALLFLVGEQRRDVIPRSLQSQHLKATDRIRVEEVEVYKTAEHPDFGKEFRRIWRSNASQPQWVVVFSPTGCSTVLHVISTDGHHSKTKVATIGPTTRAHLLEEYGFVANAVANKPTPEGLAAAIHDAHKPRGE